MDVTVGPIKKAEHRRNQLMPSNFGAGEDS